MFFHGTIEARRVLGFVLIVSWAAPSSYAHGPACSIAGANNCQIFDDSTNVRPSDLSASGGGQRTADDFVPLGDTIESVCVWGVYLAPDATGTSLIDCADEVPDEFHVVVYNHDLLGIPDFGSIKGQSNVSTVFKAHVPNTARENLTQTRVFAYQLNLTTPITGLDATGNTTYWLEVTNDTYEPKVPTPNWCFWNWMMADMVFNDFSANALGQGYGEGAGRTGDLAFCLNTDFNTPPIVLRACCDCVGVCAVSSKRACSDIDGRWVIGSNDCSPNPCTVGQPANDDCQVVAAGPAIQVGDYLINNYCATTDGPNPVPSELSAAGQMMHSDIWFKFNNTSACGHLLFSTCASHPVGSGADLDAFVAVYHDRDNPTSCVCPNAQNQSELLWPAGRGSNEDCMGFSFGAGGFVEGETDSNWCFMIRVGGGTGNETGDGVLTVDQSLNRGVCVIAHPTVGDDACSGGANDGAACSRHSDCPGGFCGAKNRFLSITPGITATETVIQVTAVQLPGALSAFNGDVWYVGTPSLVNENPAPEPTLKVAPLQCGSGERRDWRTEGLVHLYGAIIVPGATYEVRHCIIVGGGCTLPLVVQTAKFGDIVPLYVTLQPNFGDVAALVDKFRAAPGAVSKARAQLQPNIPNPNANVNFLDISLGVDAFRGQPYPFPGPPPCP